MVLFTSIINCLAIALTASAAPLNTPFGPSGQPLSISEDGQALSIDGEVINFDRATSSGRLGGHKARKHHHGQGGSSSNSSSAASTGARAIYFLTNAANNSIVALKVSVDGTVSDGTITATGGIGMSGVDSKGAPAAPDSLFSQGALKIAGNVSFLLLFLFLCHADPPVPCCCQPRL